MQFGREIMALCSAASPMIGAAILVLPGIDHGHRLAFWTPESLPIPALTARVVAYSKLVPTTVARDIRILDQWPDTFARRARVILNCYGLAARCSISPSGGVVLTPVSLSTHGKSSSVVPSRCGASSTCCARTPSLGLLLCG